MLGENHSLLNEFPEFEKVITKLISTDPSFAEDAKRYDSLDAEIRKLELRNSPIDDTSMQQMKHERAELKDLLYKRLLLNKD